MHEENTPTSTEPYDVIVIGAGISGIIFLKYAREQGLRCLALEKQDEIGGLWSWLPAWQDIQNRKEDFSIEDVSLDGVHQPDVLQYIRAWVKEYDLASFIRLQCEVTSVVRDDEVWQVLTNQGTFHARYIVAASGVQNEPWIPDVERSQSDIVELHSSALRHLEDLAGQRVAVVGGGTSAWDMLDQSIENGAKDIHWVYRSLRWFFPTSRAKQTSWPNLRELAVVQSVLRSTDSVSAFLRWQLKTLYRHFQITELEPDEPFNAEKHQLPPGRSTMMGHLDAISRHQSEVRSIRGKEITLENGEHFETDMLLWGTGYRMNLKYLGLPEYDQIETLDELRPRLGSLIRSLDYPNLFFIGMTLIDSTSATPFFDVIEAKSIVAHILGRCDIPKKPILRRVAYWDVLRYFASFDRANYPQWWKIKCFLLAWWYEIFRNRSIRV